MLRLLPLAIALGFLAACATTPLPPLSPAHPASPDAPDAAVTPVPTGLAGDETSQRTDELLEGRAAPSGGFMPGSRH